MKRRYKTPLGEVDIIAHTRKSIIFIEVKARKKREDLEFVLTKKQQERIRKAAYWYIARKPFLQNYTVRFDLITIDKNFRIRHLKDAW